MKIKIIYKLISNKKERMNKRMYHLHDYLGENKQMHFFGAKYILLEIN